MNEGLRIQIIAIQVLWLNTANIVYKKNLTHILKLNVLVNINKNQEKYANENTDVKGEKT